MSKPRWNDFARLAENRVQDKHQKDGLILSAVIDPMDDCGFKNRLIDRIQWHALRPYLPSNGGRILDFGCGTGRFAERVASLGLRYTGIDSSEYMIELALRLNTPGKFEFIHSPDTVLPFPDGSFAACLASGVLEYVITSPQCKDTMDELKRVLVPEGRLIIIGQASASGRTSDGVGVVVEEKHYHEALKAGFVIEHQERIRLSQPSIPAVISMRFPRIAAPFLNVVSSYETLKARRADMNILGSIDYYNIIIVAKAREGLRNAH